MSSGDIALQHSSVTITEDDVSNLGGTIRQVVTIHPGGVSSGDGHVPSNLAELGQFQVTLTFTGTSQGLAPFLDTTKTYKLNLQEV